MIQTAVRFPLKPVIIGEDLKIGRGLPHANKTMIGAWCFLDHIGPASLPPHGLDIGPHPHIGLQTFTWMIEGELIHRDSLGFHRMVSPNQVNLMTAGRGISHTEESPIETACRVHAAQLWIALPDEYRNIEPAFNHYPNLPTIHQEGCVFTVLAGEFLNETAPTQMYSPIVGVDITAKHTSKTTLCLRPDFEYGVLILEGSATVHGELLHPQTLMYFGVGHTELELEVHANSRVLLLGGEPFKEPVLMWWNFVARTPLEMRTALDQWLARDPIFGTVAGYVGTALTAPPLPDAFKA